MAERMLDCTTERHLYDIKKIPLTTEALDDRLTEHASKRTDNVWERHGVESMP
jgi:hypothetical protein